MTYSCPKCGRPHLTQAAAAACCAKQKCPRCNGQGTIAGGIFEKSGVCPVCKGSGVV